MDVDFANLRSILKDLNSEYVLSSFELVKIMVIVSTTLIVVSIPAAISFQNAVEDSEQIRDQIIETSSIISSDRFQSNIGVLERIEGTSFNRLSAAINSLQDYEKTVNRTEKINANLKQSRNIYQWLVVVGILGEVAAIAIYFS